jgi:hypothetical protein
MRKIDLTDRLALADVIRRRGVRLLSGVSVVLVRDYQRLQLGVSEQVSYGKPLR